MHFQSAAHPFASLTFSRIIHKRIYFLKGYYFLFPNYLWAFAAFLIWTFCLLYISVFHFAVSSIFCTSIHVTCLFSLLFFSNYSFLTAFSLSASLSFLFISLSSYCICSRLNLLCTSHNCFLSLSVSIQLMTTGPYGVIAVCLCSVFFLFLGTVYSAIVH